MSELYHNHAIRDPKTRDKLAEFMARDPHRTGAGELFYVIKQPAFPQWRFEWHPQARKVYLVRLGRKPLIGEVIAEHAETHADAYNFVQTYLRGFREGQTPDLAKPHLEG